MNEAIYSPLQLREIFHLEFLRRLSQKLKPAYFALKGGINLRFFHQSLRYSEDMEIDVADLPVEKLRDTVMLALRMPSLSETLFSFGIQTILPPDITKAKQTDTTQRFKVHLIGPGGLDLFTKIEFSRRGLDAGTAVESVHPRIIRSYRVAPFLAPHYTATTAFFQKINALADRKSPQARDIFDLYFLAAHIDTSAGRPLRMAAPLAIRRAIDNLFSIEFKQFRDTVLAFLGPEDRQSYDNPGVWDEVRLAVSRRFEELL
jgi:hypothetical protein